MKSLGTRGRWAVYGLALAGTLLAMRWAGGQDETVVRAERAAPAASSGSAGAADGAARPAAAPAAVPELDLSRLGARAAGAGGKDLFPSLSWAEIARQEEIRRAPPAKPAPPPPPQAPPLPFKYLGKLVEDGKATVFLVQGDRNLIVREGETVQGSYRIDAIAEQSMTLTYLPLKQQQTLSFAAAAAPAAGAAAGRPPVPLPGRPGAGTDRDDE